MLFLVGLMQWLLDLTLFDPLPFCLVSEAPKAAPVASKYQSYQKVQTDEEKKEELVAAMITRMGDKDEEKLPQDDMEGVDSDEWVSFSCVCVCACVDTFLGN